jgi:putative phosphoserine phosphatase/1-acylglycerol-3-phosphate O-acyltransferase
MAGLPIWALTGSQREARNFATSLFADVSSALIGLKLVVRGEENLWSHRPAVFVFNHQSKADVVIIARLLRRDIAGVGKKEIKRMPLIGKTLELAGTVFIDRENAASAIEAMQPLVDAMRNAGKSVVIAPEGTRTISPRLAPFKKGAFHLAIQAGVPMVPIVIHNAGDVAPKGDFIFRPATVEVDVLPPVDTSEWRPETIDRHVAQIRRLFQVTLRQEQPAEATPAAVEAADVVTTDEVEGQSELPAAAVPAAVTAPRKKAARKKTALKKASRKKASRKKAARKKAAPKKASRKKAARKEAAPSEVAPRESAPGKASQKKVARTEAAPKKVLKKKARKKKPLKKPVEAKTAAGAKRPRKPPRRKPLRKKVLPGKVERESRGE